MPPGLEPQIRTPATNRKKMVGIGAPGFEPGTFGSQSRRATGLRHAPCHVWVTAWAGVPHQPLPSGGWSFRWSVLQVVGSRVVGPPGGRCLPHPFGGATKIHSDAASSVPSPSSFPQFSSRILQRTPDRRQSSAHDGRIRGHSSRFRASRHSWQVQRRRRVS